jgi:hypothetical protein
MHANLCAFPAAPLRFKPLSVLITVRPVCTVVKKSLLPLRLLGRSSAVQTALRVLITLRPVYSVVNKSLRPLRLLGRPSAVHPPPCADHFAPRVLRDKKISASAVPSGPPLCGACLSLC